MEFPKTLTAARKVKGTEWTLADALLEEIGPRGSEQRLTECAEYLAEHGIDYKASYLQRLHNAARNFPRGGRPPWLTPEHATKAGSPEVVEHAVAIKRERAAEEEVDYTPPSKREIMATRRQVVAHAREESGGVKMPTRDAMRRAAVSATPSALQQTATTLELETLADHAKMDAQKLLRKVSGHEFPGRARRDLLAAVDEVLEAWQWTRDAIENPLSEEIADYLANL